MTLLGRAAVVSCYSLNLTIISLCLLLSFLPSFIVRADNAWGWEPSISVAADLDEPNQLGFCLDIKGFGSGINCESLQAHSCKESASDTQFEHVSTTNSIRSVNYDSNCNVNTSPNDRACVTVTGNLLPNAELGLTSCDESSDNQIFEAKPIAGGHVLRAGGEDTGLCLVVSDTTRAAGRYVARNLFIAVCSQTDNELKTWTISPTPPETVCYDPVLNVAKGSVQFHNFFVFLFCFLYVFYFYR